MLSVLKASNNAKEIAKIISGKSLIDIKVLNNRYDVGQCCDDLRLELPKNVVGVGRHGKFIFIIVDGGDSSIWINDGSIGVWSSIERKGSAVVLTLSDGSKMVYQGPVKEGVLRWSRGRKPLKKRLLSLGLDISSRDFEEKNFIEYLNKNQKASVAEALLNEEVICSFSNLECSEILWRSKLSPHRKIDSLCLEEFQMLYKAANDLFQEIKINLKMFDKIQVKKLQKDSIGNTIKLEYFGRKIIWWSPDVQL